MADPRELTDDEILAKVEAQTESEQIAESLGMSVEDYAKRVLFYVRNPGKEPVLEVMDELEAREAGMPSPAECAQFLEDAVDAAEQEEKAHYAGFDDDEKSAATTTGASGKKRAPRMGEARGEIYAASSPLGDSLKAELTEARRRSQSASGRAEPAKPGQPKAADRGKSAGRKPRAR